MATPNVHQYNLQDFWDADHVGITVDAHNKLWVNVDGKCMLRIGQVKVLDIETPKDSRRSYASGAW